MALAATPTNFYAQTAAGSVYLTWSASAGATSYQVQRSTDGVTFSNLASPAVLQYQDTTATLGTNYYYQVASINGSGTGAFTTPVSVVPVLDGTMSLGQLRLAAQQRADRVNSPFVSLPEWNSYLNQSLTELYDLLVTLFEDYYVAAPLAITTTGSQLIPLPDGTLYTAAQPFYKLLGVDMAVSGAPGGYISLKKFNFLSRNRYYYPQIQSTVLGATPPEYRVMGSNLLLTPTPTAGQTLQIWYVPRLRQLALDTDIADGVSGWLEYVIVDAAIKALQKEEADVTVLAMQKAALRERIENSGMNRDAGQPSTITDVHQGFGTWGGPQGGF
jgi:hypothetical protein